MEFSFSAVEGKKNQQVCLINRWLLRSAQQELTQLLPGQGRGCEHCARASLPTEAGSGENLSPSFDDASLAVDDRMVEGEAVQVECHRRHAARGDCGKHPWLSDQEKCSLRL